MIWPTLDPAIGIPILIACGIGYLVAFVILIWPGTKAEAGGNGPQNYQSTAGDGSPAVGTVGRDATFNITTQAPANRPKRDPGGWPIADAIEAIQNAVGGDRDAWIEFRQAARDNEIGVWGRPETTGSEITTNRRWGELRREIPSGYWERWRLRRDVAQLRLMDAPHTEPEYGSHTYDTYTAITVEKEEIERLWLRPGPQMFVIGRPDLGPHGWMR